MNVAQIKAGSWLAAGVLTLALSGYVFLFISGMDKELVDAAEVRKALEDVQPLETKADDLISYEDVKRLFHERSGLNWTGLEARPEEPVGAGPEAPKPTAVPVAELVRILMIQVDTVDPKGSRVFLKYTAKAGVPAAPVIGGYSLAEGDHLLAPHDHVRVEAIAVDGVTFAFADEARERETLGPTVFDARTTIVTVGPDGVRYPVRTSFPTGKRDPAQDARTRRVGPNIYKVGFEDAADFNANYHTILTQDVRYERHRDASTGKYDGVELSEVKEDSIAERHGAQKGDVIKSINGHPVTSVTEAVNFVKNNAGKYATWDVVVERRGKEITITYETP